MSCSTVWAACCQSFQTSPRRHQRYPVIPEQALGDRLVMTISGDTIKNPHQRSGWPDGTPGGTNLLFVQGAGQIPGGRSVDATPTAAPTGYPATGRNQANVGNDVCTSAACGGVLYAVANGSKDAVRQFYNGPLDGVINANLTGS